MPYSLKRVSKARWCDVLRATSLVCPFMENDFSLIKIFAVPVCSYLFGQRLDRAADRRRGFQRCEERVALLAKRGVVAAQPSERSGAAVGAKAAEDLPLHLEHAQVADRPVPERSGTAPAWLARHSIARPDW